MKINNCQGELTDIWVYKRSTGGAGASSLTNYMAYVSSAINRCRVAIENQLLVQY